MEGAGQSLGEEEGLESLGGRQGRRGKWRKWIRER